MPKNDKCELHNRAERDTWQGDCGRSCLSKNFMTFLIAALTIAQWASKLKWRYVPCFATKNVFVGKAIQYLSI